MTGLLLGALDALLASAEPQLECQHLGGAQAS